MKSIIEMIDQEKKSDSVARRFAAFVLDEAFDMDWIGEDTEAIGFDHLVEEIENSELIMSLAERIVWRWE